MFFQLQILLFVRGRHVDYESRLKAKPQQQQQKQQNDTIKLWQPHETLFSQLDVQFINKENEMILTEVHGVPRRMNFSIQVFKHYTIFCSK